MTCRRIVIQRWLKAKSLSGGCPAAKGTFLEIVGEQLRAVFFRSTGTAADGQHHHYKENDYPDHESSLSIDRLGTPIVRNLSIRENSPERRNAVGFRRATEVGHCIAIVEQVRNTTRRAGWTGTEGNSVCERRATFDCYASSRSRPQRSTQEASGVFTYSPARIAGRVGC